MFTQVFSLKMIKEVFKSLNAIMITVDDDYVIHIDNQVDALTWREQIMDS